MVEITLKCIKIGIRNGKLEKISFPVHFKSLYLHRNKNFKMLKGYIFF